MEMLIASIPDSEVDFSVESRGTGVYLWAVKQRAGYTVINQVY